MSLGNPVAAESRSALATPTLSSSLVIFLAICCGAVVANLYYAQPIVELIAPSIGLSSANASLIVSLTQFGYAIGLLFLVPLADLLENRRLLVGFTLAAAVCLAGAALSTTPSLFLISSLLIGLTSVAVQILVPLAAHMAPEASRGRVVGNIMSGLLLGILLSRPISSTLAEAFGWRGVFFGAAGLMAFMAVVMGLLLPRRVPTHQASYAQLIGSVFTLARRYAVLRERSLYQGLLFAAFSSFWTIAPIELVRHYGFSQTEVAIFALVGAVGAIAAPIAGRLADAGHGVRGTLAALLLAPLSLIAGSLSGAGWLWMVVTAVALDFAVQLNMVLGQREIYALDPHSRARLNAVYMTSIFVGGALGSLIASPLYEHVGWPLFACMAALPPLAALILFILRPRG
ncbi:MFS transporter [Pseudomonas putida CSV86]|uniref:MFS transporter n=1 Tax=Pseudomonas bharatica CSV86 TaxID=1005395 RepID=L1LU05_9PSED|nr:MULTISPECIES: MFS transporter [Pseudomonas]MDG9882874.1 MFS transporter [Pseudomonas sp. GD04058]NNJ17558.1 MFS transporter [Pseudomonas bharatica CSV86]